MNPEVTENKPENKIEQAQTAPETQTNQETTPSIKSEENKENWRKFREQQKAERLAKEQAEKLAAEERARAEALKAALEAVTNKPTQQQYYNEEEETEEQRIEKLVEKKLKEKESRLEQERRLREQQELPKKIAQIYPDFNQVCSDENVDYLKFHYPEVAAAFNNLPDTVENWSNVYKTIKRLVKNPDHFEDQKKIEQNLMKPGSVSRQGVTQGTGAMPSNRLTEERKAANWERMQRLLKGLNNS